jgi:hypothetical protein
VRNTDFDNARAAYERAWAEAKRHGDDALEALQKADLVTSADARELFQAAADRALAASENWRKAAELAQEVMQEIAAGIPRRR